ncbi:MAG: hypothetical protein Q9188_000210 [Gyalolechia gomerana]
MSAGELLDYCGLLTIVQTVWRTLMDENHKEIEKRNTKIKKLEGKLTDKTLEGARRPQAAVIDDQVSGSHKRKRPPTDSEDKTLNLLRDMTARTVEAEALVDALKEDIKEQKLDI